MTPDAGLVRELQAYDPQLRIRWGRHSEKWIIESHRPCKDQRLAQCAAPPDDAAAIKKDLYEGWKDGYLHVLTVPRELAYWRFIAPELARMDSWRQGGFEKINDQLDQDAVDWEKAADKRVDNYVEDATSEAYERLAWLQGRRVAVTRPEQPLVDTGLGFKMRDRRRG